MNAHMQNMQNAMMPWSMMPPQMPMAMMSRMPHAPMTSQRTTRHHRLYGDSLRFLMFAAVVFLVGFSTPFWLHVEMTQVKFDATSPTPPANSTETTTRGAIIWRNRTPAPQSNMTVNMLAEVTPEAPEVTTTYSMGMWMLCATVGYRNATSCDSLHAVPFESSRWFQSVRALQCLCLIGVMTSSVCLIIVTCSTRKEFKSRSRFLELLSALSSLLGVCGAVVFLISAYNADHIIAQTATTVKINWYFSWAVFLDLVGASLIFIASSALAIFKTVSSNKVGIDGGDDDSEYETDDEDDGGAAAGAVPSTATTSFGGDGNRGGETTAAAEGATSAAASAGATTTTNANTTTASSTADTNNSRSGGTNDNSVATINASGGFPHVDQFSPPAWQFGGHPGMMMNPAMMNPAMMNQAMMNPAFLQQFGYVLDANGEHRLADAHDPPPSYQLYMEQNDMQRRRSSRLSQEEVAQVLGLHTQNHSQDSPTAEHSPTQNSPRTEPSPASQRSAESQHSTASQRSAESQHSTASQRSPEAQNAIGSTQGQSEGQVGQGHVDATAEQNGQYRDSQSQSVPSTSARPDDHDPENARSRQGQGQSQGRDLGEGGGSVASDDDGTDDGGSTDTGSESSTQDF